MLRRPQAPFAPFYPVLPRFAPLRRMIFQFFGRCPCPISGINLCINPGRVLRLRDTVFPDDFIRARSGRRVIRSITLCTLLFGSDNVDLFPSDNVPRHGTIRTANAPTISLMKRRVLSEMCGSVWQHVGEAPTKRATKDCSKPRCVEPQIGTSRKKIQVAQNKAPGTAADASCYVRNTTIGNGLDC